jgi:hypothetical protein
MQICLVLYYLLLATRRKETIPHVKEWGASKGTNETQNNLARK